MTEAERYVDEQTQKIKFDIVKMALKSDINNFLLPLVPDVTINEFRELSLKIHALIISSWEKTL